MAAHVVHLLREIGDAGLAQVVRGLADETVIEVCAAEGACHERRGLTVGSVHFHYASAINQTATSTSRLGLRTVVTDVAEHLLVTHLAERNLAPVAVREKVLERVKGLTEQAVRLPEVSTFVPVCPTAVVNAGLQRAPDVGGRCIPALVLAGHVFLEAYVRADSDTTHGEN